MHRTYRLLSSAALSFVALASLGAQVAPSTPLAPYAPDARTPLLTSVAWLAQHRADPGLVLLHVGAPADFASAHIEGARQLVVGDITVTDTAKKLTAEMPSPAELRARLAAYGVTDQSRVVVYVAKDMHYQSARVLFALFYAGLGDRATWLDGGLPAWIAAGQPVVASTAAAAAAATSAPLSPLKIRNFVVDADFVKASIGKAGVSIVDARDSAFYSGAKQGGTPQAPHRAGHIPSAHSLPWTTLYDEKMQLKPRDELARLFAAAGVGAKDVIVGYCHSGQQATAMLLAARSLGYSVLLYDGSYQEWSAKVELPVEGGR